MNQMDDLMLPPLPVTNVIVDGLWEEQYGPYTADQMREYAKMAVEAEREACAEVCDDLAFDWHKHAAGGLVGAYNACAAAIRARGKHD